MTGVDVVINGIPKWSASNFGLTEEATPVEASDRSGAVGQFTFDLDYEPAAKTWRGKTVDLSSGSQGQTEGKITAISWNPSSVTVTADSRLGSLTVIRTAQPYVGTLEGALRYYFGLVGLTTNIIVDSTLGATSVVFPGWNASVWDQVKSMCAALQFEVSLVSNNIVVRPLRGRIAQTYRDSAHAGSIDDSQIAQNIQVSYYTNTFATKIAYPIGGWTPAATVFSGIGVNETTVTNVPLSASLSSVQQPVCVGFVDRNYVASSVYSVTGNDGLPVSAAEWIAEGGSVTVAIAPDTKSLNITIVGSSNAQYAPYKIAVSDSTSNDFSSLRIVGTGVFFDKQTLTLWNGISPDKAPTVTGAVIENEFISSIGDAWTAGGRALARWSGGRQQIQVSTTGINRTGDTGSLLFETVGQFNASVVGMTISAYTAANPGQTVEQANDAALAAVRSSFANQGFGNYAGARTLDDFAWYRIRSASPGPAGVSYTAEADTLISDFNAVWAGQTIAQLTAARGGTTLPIDDFNVRPLGTS